MRQTNNKKKRDKVAAVIMLSFCLIALTSIFTIKANIDKLSNNAKNVVVDKSSSTAEKAETKVKSEDKDKSDETQASAAVNASTPTVDSKKQVPETAIFKCPIAEGKGEILKEYSMDMIIYSVTLDQFMTHPGLDIKADENTPVNAIAAGTVTDILEDDCYGSTVEITHPNGYISRYCNLADKRSVEKGDSVVQGQVLGKVGRSGMYESLEPAHLHLEILKSGKTCNPKKFISVK